MSKASEFLRCQGCGCLYVRHKSSDFCDWCCKQIKDDPLHFQTLAEKEKRKSVENRP